MKCNKAEELILLNDSGELSGKKAGLLTAHVRECISCQKFQQALSMAVDIFQTGEEPSSVVVQNILREARLRAPEKRHASIFGWKPAMALAASLVIGFGIFFSTFNHNKVGMELVVTEAQLLEPEDQIVSVMYDGLSEDDLAFNFLMTYEGDTGS